MSDKWDEAPVRYSPEPERERVRNMPDTINWEMLRQVGEYRDRRDLRDPEAVGRAIIGQEVEKPKHNHWGSFRGELGSDGMWRVVPVHVENGKH